MAGNRLNDDAAFMRFHKRACALVAGVLVLAVVGAIVAVVL